VVRVPAGVGQPVERLATLDPDADQAQREPERVLLAELLPRTRLRISGSIRSRGTVGASRSRTNCSHGPKCFAGASMNTGSAMGSPMGRPGLIAGSA
jgi:hypothetical protein